MPLSVRAISACISLAIMLHSPIAKADMMEVSPDQLFQQFDDVVFGHEHGMENNTIRRWGAPLEVAIFSSPALDTPPPLGRIQSVLTEISRITGIDVARADDNTQATLRLGYFPRRDFAALPAADKTDPRYHDFINRSACLGVSNSESDRIKGGVIMIGSDISPALQDHCLVEELVQIMGLPNDACNYQPSLFCEADHVTELTKADKALLSMLYDPRLQSGMERADALAHVREMILERVTEADPMTE
ncbi:hypothetical protein GCM10007972_12530 [Iodidimonas muriae]|uniref:DUF2927 domain-containing protein n=1 Tax=Iodidimonas muriae TaxID=261467 RepID=A0ABQ2LCH2_9PROT|nr:DUF2927 domain-containing protein [Iodidimonas muriae]GER06746.1 hypothetical protein JCM17843_10560 [Kordiimonadales bacterium JCM 17843]GGO10153.1 hypothetical protein GCM10007972_12530 [Iodidimonas muriae]